MNDKGLPEDMQLYNPRQVAERLGVSARSVLRWIQSGKLEGQRLGERQYRVSKEALEKFLANTKETAQKVK